MADINSAWYLAWIKNRVTPEVYNKIKLQLAQGMNPETMPLFLEFAKQYTTTQNTPVNIIPSTQPRSTTTGGIPTVTQPDVTTTTVPEWTKKYPGIKQVSEDRWVWDDVSTGMRVFMDANGLYADQTEIPQTGTGGGWDYNTQNLMRQAGQDAETNRFNWAQLDWQKQQAAQTAETARQANLLSLSQQPSDWITYYNAAYGKNPPAPKWLNDYMGKDVNSPAFTGMTSTGLGGFNTDESGNIIGIDTSATLEGATMPGQIARWQKSTNRQQDFAPQYGQTGGTIQAMNVPTPSGQWMNRASPTALGLLKGYADWSAAQNQSMTYEDLIQSAKNQRPTANAYTSSGWKAKKQKGW
jgi:hypothetical protein